MRYRLLLVLLFLCASALGAQCDTVSIRVETDKIRAARDSIATVLQPAYARTTTLGAAVWRIDSIVARRCLPPAVTTVALSFDYLTTTLWPYGRPGMLSLNDAVVACAAVQRTTIPGGTRWYLGSEAVTVTQWVGDSLPWTVRPERELTGLRTVCTRSWNANSLTLGGIGDIDTAPIWPVMWTTMRIQPSSDAGLTRIAVPLAMPLVVP